MDISLPVKTNIAIKDLDISNVEKWITEQVVLNPSATISLKHCYEAYKEYLELKKELVTLTKKCFSSLFRNLVKEDEDNGKIRFYPRSSILIKGVEIKAVEIGE